MNIPEEIKNKTTRGFLLSADLLEVYNETSMSMGLDGELSNLVDQLNEKTNDPLYAKELLASYLSFSTSIKEILEKSLNLFDEMKELDMKVNPENYNESGTYVKSREL